MNFPYEIIDLDGSIVQVQRLIDGIPSNHNEFNPGQDTTLLFLPVWQFQGMTDQKQNVTFWVPAVLPNFIQEDGLATQ